MRLITDWFKRSFSDPQVVFLVVVLGGGLAIILTMGHMLAPVLASVVIAYLLEGLVGMAQRRRLPRLVAVILVFLLFLVFVTLVIFGLMPLLSRQVTDLVGQLPVMIAAGQQALMGLPESYPEMVSAEQVQQILDAIRREILALPAYHRAALETVAAADSNRAEVGPRQLPRHGGRPLLLRSRLSFPVAAGDPQHRGGSDRP